MNDSTSPTSVQARPAVLFPPLTLEREYNEKGTRDAAQGRTSIEFQQNGVPIGIWIDFEEEGRGKRSKLFAAAPELLAACRLVDAALGDPVEDATAEVPWSTIRAVRAAMEKAATGFDAATFSHEDGAMDLRAEAVGFDVRQIGLPVGVLRVPCLRVMVDGADGKPITITGSGDNVAAVLSSLGFRIS